MHSKSMGAKFHTIARHDSIGSTNMNLSGSVVAHTIKFTIPFLKKRNCRHCHFLEKEYRDESCQVYTNPLSEEERKIAETSPEGVVEDRYSLACYMGVWDEGIGGSKKDRNHIINKTPRGNNCYFYPYTSSTSLEAAKKLQKVAVDTSKQKKTNFYSKLGILFAGVIAVVAIIELFWKND
jgi:hypothetical protein